MPKLHYKGEMVAESASLIAIAEECAPGLHAAIDGFFFKQEGRIVYVDGVDRIYQGLRHQDMIN